MRIIYNDNLSVYDSLISKAVQDKLNVVGGPLPHSVDMLTTIFRLLGQMGGGSRVGLFRSLLRFMRTESLDAQFGRTSHIKG